MADKEFIIEVVLKARDDMAAAFAAATAEMRGFDAELKAQKRQTEEATAANAVYAAELEHGTSSVERHKKAVQDLGLEYEKDGKKTATVSNRILALDQAVSNLTKTQEGAGRAAKDDTVAKAQMEIATRKVEQAENSLARALVKKNQGNREAAKSEAETIRLSIERISRSGIAARTFQAEAVATAAQVRETDRLVSSTERHAKTLANVNSSQRQDLEAKRAVLATTQLLVDKGLLPLVEAQERVGAVLKQARQDQGFETQVQRDSAREDIAHTAALEMLAKAEGKASDARLQRAKTSIRLDTAQKAIITAQEQVVTRAYRPAEILARTGSTEAQEAQATRALADAKSELIRKGVSEEEAERRIHEVRQQALKDYGFESQAVRNATRDVERYQNTVSKVRRAGGDVTAIARPAEETFALARPQAGMGGETGDVTSLSGALKGIQSSLASADSSTTGFIGHLKSAFGFGIVGLIQPLAVLLVGLVGAFTALASAAIAAGAAIGATFVSAIAQGIPVMGLFAIAMQRLQSVMGYVQTLLQKQQAAWIAQFETQKQTQLGINQVIIAEHQYSDALFAQQSALINVGVAQHSYQDSLFSLRQAQFAEKAAEFGLLQTRQQATRQLQDLIFAEVQARLAAEASALAVTHSQLALRQAIATGGDVATAQLGLSQATAQHHQAVTESARASQDAARGSITRQGIALQLQEAANTVTASRRAVTDAQFAVSAAARGVAEARRAVVDAQFQVAQARAAIAEAQLAAKGYNLGTEAQLAYLRATMSKTEFALSKNILNILGLFRSIPGHAAAFRGITDAILGPFVTLTSRILQVLKDPKVFGALTNLANAMKRGMGTVIDAIFNPRSIRLFTSIIGDAAKNVGPFAKIIGDMFKIIQDVVVAAGPSLGSFLKYLAGVADHFAKLAGSTKGQKWLSDFFKLAFSSLTAFFNLGLAVIKLVLSIVDAGGGAKTGMGLIKSFTDTINNLTDAINNKHSKAFKDLQTLWKTAPIALHVLGEILGSVGKALLDLAGSKRGQDALKNLGDFVAHIIIPAFVKFIEEIGKVVGKILDFLQAHPKLQKALVDFLGTALAIGFATKAVRLILGPLAEAVKIAINLGKAFKFIKDLEMAKIFSGIASGAKNFGSGFAGIFRGRLPGRAASAGAGAAGAAENAGTAAAGLGTAGVGAAEAGALGGAEAGVGGLAATAGAATGIGLVIAAIIALVAWTGKLGALWSAIKAPFIAIWAAIKGPIKDLGTQFNYFIGAFKGASGPIGIFKTLLGGVFTFIFGLAKIVFGGIGKAIGDFFGGIIKVISGIFEIIGGILHGNLHKVVDGAKKIGLGLLQGIFAPIKDLGQILGTLISKAISGLIKFGKNAFNAGVQLIGQLASGITKLPHILATFGTWLWGQIKNTVSDLPSFFLQLGKDMIQGIVSGIKAAPKLILDAIKSLIPGPILKALSLVKGVVGDVWGALTGQEGGPVPGYGGGDTHPYLLEGGEHILTKEEVQSAGGHGAIFAMRSALGGGGQGGPRGYQTGGEIAVRPGGPSVGPGGQFQDPSQVLLQTTGFLSRTIAIANRAQSVISRRIASGAISITKGLTIFLANYDQISQLFDLAATTIQNAADKASDAASLLANGFKLVGNRLVQVGALGALQQAQAFVKAADTNISSLRQLQGSENTALDKVNAELRKLGKPRTKEQQQLYNRLIGARQGLLNQIQTTDDSLVSALQSQYTAATNALDTAAQRQMAALDIRDRLAPVIAGLGGAGGQQAAAALQVSTSQARTQALQGQIGGYQSLLQDATAKGNTQAMHDLQDKIADLTTQVAESILATQQLVTSQAQLAATMVATRASAASGAESAASGIITTLGQITGSMNLPQLIAGLKSAAADLASQVPGILKAVQGAAGGTAFGAFQGQAGGLLQQLAGAFQAGPMQYAQSLSQLAPQIAALEASMPSDMSTLFQGLIDSMTGNTQATADNTLQLRQLEATTLTQDFTSSAWSQFRSAIFTGIGTLLPQFAMSVPSAQVGAHIKSAGLIYGHSGETIVPAQVKSPYQVGPMEPAQNHFHFNEPMEVADPVHLGNRIAFRLNHDPNAR